MHSFCGSKLMEFHKFLQTFFLSICNLQLIACKQLITQEVQDRNWNNQMHTHKKKKKTMVPSFLCVSRKGYKCWKQGETWKSSNIYFLFLSLSLVYIMFHLDGFQIKNKNNNKKPTFSAVISDYVLYQAWK